jgi:hypothetical protein
VPVSFVANAGNVIAGLAIVDETGRLTLLGSAASITSHNLPLAPRVRRRVGSKQVRVWSKGSTNGEPARYVVKTVGKSRHAVGMPPVE